jgi:hypothetical protein
MGVHPVNSGSSAEGLAFFFRCASANVSKCSITAAENNRRFFVSLQLKTIVASSFAWPLFAWQLWPEILLPIFLVQSSLAACEEPCCRLAFPVRAWLAWHPGGLCFS